MSETASQPSDLEHRFRAAAAAHAAGRVDEAQAAYRAILDAKPDHAGALANLGRIARTQGRSEDALALYRQAAAAPGAPGEVFFNLASALADAGAIREALGALADAVRRAPTLTQAHRKRAQLARLGVEQGVLPADAALAVAREAASAAPADAVVFQALADLERAAGDPEAAARARRAADALSSGDADAITRLADERLSEGDGDGSVALLRHIVDTAPESPSGWRNLGYALRTTGHYLKALKAYERCAALGADDPLLHTEIANCLVNQGRPGEARATFLRLLDTPDGRAAATSGYLMSLLYDPDASPETISAEHRRLTAEWPASPPPPPPGPRSQERALRVGYLTADFYGEHPVAQFVAPLIEAQAGMDVETRVYLARTGRDATAKRLSGIGRMRVIEDLDDDDAAKTIAGDDLDVLVDLSGHTSRHRLKVLGRRPAAAQACFVGYPSTTGYAGVDALFADDALAPVADEALYAERVVRLPTWLAFAPPPSFPERPKRTGRPNRRVTFGSLNHLPKLNAGVIDLWARVLAAAPETDLLLKCAAFAEPESLRAVAGAFVQRGIAAERLKFEGPEPFTAAMRAYHRIDIALDPFPYNGGTTTAHALWMGAPTVTLRGRWFCGRMGASLMTGVGRPQWIADDADAYVRIAADLARDPARLAQEQARLIDDFAASRVGQVETWARAARDAYAGLAGLA